MHLLNIVKRNGVSKLIKKLLSLSRFKKQIIILLVDSVLILLILLASFSIRLGYWYFPGSNLVWVIFSAPIAAIPIFMKFGLYHTVTRHIEFKALLAVTKAVSLYALICGLVSFMIAVDGIPRSVILINWTLSLVVIGGVRIIARILLGARAHSNKKRVMVYGAGDAGVQLVSALEHSSEHRPVGFIDDNRSLHGQRIRGLIVYSNDEINDLIDKLKLDEILIAIPSTSRARRLAIIDKLQQYSVFVRILPGVSEFAQGKVNIDDLRQVNIKDLLGREPVKCNMELLGKNITNKAVVVTGAGGSIGSELCKQILLLKPKTLVLYEMSEFALYNIEKVLNSMNTDASSIYPILGSINNKNRLKSVFKRFNINTIYHAAAYKHVPIVEFNTSEGVDNNILGTLNCAEVAIESEVETFVLISTDKAVRPTNTMGATKRIAELVLQALSVKQSTTNFCMVRFGNVLGSSGSVIPLFEQQIKQGGPVTVTNKDIIRYFMTIPEAVELVIQAGSMNKGGDVFVLDMGKPVRIKDLAEKMIHLSGLAVKDDLNPDGDIEIIYTGLRPGEKLFEELLIGDNVSETDNPLIMRAKEDMLDWNELKQLIDGLSAAVDSDDQVSLRRLLVKIVPGFKPQSEISDILYKNGLQD